MSRCLRYRNPEICQHLAGQYVAGVMTKRVRQRTEALLQQTPELDRAIAHWSDEFSILHGRLPEIQLDASVHNKIWSRIESEANISKGSSKATQDEGQRKGWWYNLILWRLFSGISVLASMVLAIILVFTSPQAPVLTGPSYLANMSAHDDSSQTIQFVISAYAKQADTPSRLQVQWRKEHAGQKLPSLHLWAEEKDTGKLVYIGLKPEKGEPWNLTKPTWTAISNSHRLFMTADAQKPSDTNIVFSGLCLQLTEWKS